MRSALKKILTTLPILLLTACGVSDSTPGLNDASGGINQNETILPDGSNVEGIYAGELWPMNHNLHFKTVGWAAVQREGDDFSAYVRLQYGSKPNVEYKQAIYTGRRCPSLKDDLNKDAYIDMQEALAAIGQSIIPLDGNLNSQKEGQYIWPNGKDTGKYFYQMSASFDRMFSDLKLPDEDRRDNITKLPLDGGLTFPGRVVIIQGLSEKISLPKSVSGYGAESPHESIPVACAVLWKVDELPSELSQ